MSVLYSVHARERMRRRRVVPGDVLAVITTPDELDYGEAGEILATRRLGRRRIRVVYSETATERHIITVIVL